MESRATGRMSSRLRPMSTCAISSIEIARKAYAEAQGYNGAIGIMTNNIGSLAYFLMYALHYNQYLLLSLLAFLDDRILALENAVEACFPPLNCVFNVIDKLLQMVETLPEYFDVCVRKLSARLSQVPFVNMVLVWALSWLNVWFFVSKFHVMLFAVPFVQKVLVCAISRLSFLLSILIRWGSESPMEKEIVVDVNCKDSSHESAGASAGRNETVERTYNNNPEKAMNGSYKEALEKEKSEKRSKMEVSICKDELEKGIQIEEDVSDGKGPKMRPNISVKTVDEDGSKEETNVSKGGMKLSVNTMEESPTEDDPILELFESAWLMTPRDKRAGSRRQSWSFET